MSAHTVQLAPAIWWAYVRKQRADGGFDIDGDMFDSPNAEQLAADWIAKRGLTTAPAEASQPSGK